MPIQSIHPIFYTTYNTLGCGEPAAYPKGLGSQSWGQPGQCANPSQWWLRIMYIVCREAAGTLAKTIVDSITKSERQKVTQPWRLLGHNAESHSTINKLDWKHESEVGQQCPIASKYLSSPKTLWENVLLYCLTDLYCLRYQQLTAPFG